MQPIRQRMCVIRVLNITIAGNVFKINVFFFFFVNHFPVLGTVQHVSGIFDTNYSTERNYEKLNKVIKLASL